MKVGCNRKSESTESGSKSDVQCGDTWCVLQGEVLIRCMRQEERNADNPGGSAPEDSVRGRQGERDSHECIDQSDQDGNTKPGPTAVPHQAKPPHSRRTWSR